MQRILWWMASCLVAATLVPVGPASAVPPASPEPVLQLAAARAPAEPALLDTACESADGRLRHTPSGGCGRGLARVLLRTDERVATCLLPGRGVRRLGRTACEARGGSPRLLPDNDPTRLCAPRRGGPLRWVDSFGACRAGEVRRLVRNLPPGAPTLAGRAVTEDVAVGTVVGTLRAPDPNLGDSVRFVLAGGPGGADNGRFDIAGNRLVTASAMDHEADPVLRVRVQAVDLQGRRQARPFTIVVDDREENRPPTAISLDASDVAENEPAGTTVGSLTTTDPDPGDDHSYALVSEPGVADDNAAFRIVGGDLQTATSFDFETGGATRSVRVRSEDGEGGSITQVLQVGVTDANEAPTALSLAPATVEENRAGAVVGTLSAADPDAGDTHTYALVAGAGATSNALFALSGDQVSTAVALDFESTPSPSIRVRVSDAAGASYEQVLVVGTRDGNDAPSAVALSPASVAENRPAGTEVGSLSALDQDSGDAHSFTLVAGSGDTHNASFTITGSRLTTAAAFDYETTGPLSIRVRAVDGSGAPVESVVTVAVTNVNEAPATLDLSSSTVAEDRPVGSDVATLTSTDPDGPGTHTYTLVPGAGDTDNADFEIVGDRLRTAALLDFESTTSYSVRIRSQDAEGERLERAFTIAVLDRNEAPTSLTLSNDTVAENQPAGTTVGTLLSVDPDAGDTVTYALVGGPGSGGNDAFSLAGSTLSTAAAFDHEGVASYAIRVRVTDAGTPGLTREETFTVHVGDVDEAPTGLVLTPATLAENEPAGTTVGTVAADDPEGRPIVYTLVAGSGDDDNALFSLVGEELVALGSADFETDAALTVRVRADDGSGGVQERALAVTVTDVNDAPSAVLLAGDVVDEDAAADTVVGTLSTTDQDAGDTHTYALASGAGDDDNARFRVVGDELRSVGGLDAESEPTLSVRISSTDAAGARVATSFPITVTDVNEAPTAITLSSATVPEETASYVVGTLGATDADGAGPYTFALVAGAGDTDNASFAIVGSTLRVTSALDLEPGPPTRTVRVRVSDAAGASHEQALTITVTDVNDAPSAVLLTGSTVGENLPAGAAVGTLSATDQDAGDTHTYSLVIGPGSTGNASFALTPQGALSTAASLDYEAWASPSIRVRATDAAGAFVEQVLTVTVTNVNEAPSDLDISATTVAENQPAGTLVGTLSSDDPDLGDAVVFALVAGAGDDDNADFQVDGVRFETAALLDHEAGETRSVRLRVSDASGEQAERVFVIAVTDVNEAPTDLALPTATVPENHASYDVGTLSVTDADGVGPYTFALVPGAGDTHNADFALAGTTLRATTAFDFENGSPTRSVRVRVTDAGGASFARAFTVTVTDANDAPSGATLSADTIAENAAAGSIVGTLTTSDPDADDSHTWSLVAGTGSGGNASFALSAAGELSTTGGLDHESDPTLSIRVRATDAGGLFVERVLTITVTDVNEAPSAVTLSSSAVAEGKAVGTVVGTLGATDPDAGDSFGFTLLPGSSPHLTIVGDQLRTTSALDFEGPEGAAGLTALVRASDASGASTDESFVVSITDVNEAPTALAMADRQVDENQAIGTPVGTLAGSDPDAGDPLVYALATGAGADDNARFSVVAATGEVRTAELLDHEAAPTRSIRVKVTDAAGLALEHQVTIDVGDLNDAPTVLPDSYTGVVGNTQARLGGPAAPAPAVVLTGALPLANDTDQDGDTVRVVAQGNVATSAGGTVDLAVDGSFRYLPGVGDKSLTDTFTYRVTDGVATSEGTVSLVISDRLVWYVDRAFSGVPDGRSTAPYPSLSPLNGTGGAGDPDGAGDTIFVHTGSYGAGIALEDAQRLLGAGAGLAPGLVAPGAAPVLNPVSGTAVALDDGTSVDGLDISVSGAAAGLTAGSVTAAQVGPDVELTSTGSTGPVVAITGVASGDITVDAPITNGGTGHAVRVVGRSGGTVSFPRPVTTSGPGPRGGISLSSNTGATVGFGRVTLSTGGSAGMSVASGGTVTVSDPTSTISTGTNTALSVTDTTIGSAFTFRSISATAASAIVLQNTGTSGRLVVTGNSTGACGGTVSAAGVVTQTPVAGDCSGGTIANATGPGIRLSNTQGPSLTRMWIHHGKGDGIQADGVTGGLTIAHSLIEANGDGVHENGVDLGDSASTTPQGVTGTTTITSSTVRDSADSNIELGNSSGTATLTITGSRISGAGGAGSVQDGVLVRALGSATVATEIRANSFAGNLGDHVQVASGGSSQVTGATVAANTMTGDSAGAQGQGVTIGAAGLPWSGSLRFDVSGNQIEGAQGSAVTLSGSGTAAGTVFAGSVRNNVIGSGAAYSCSQSGHGIDVTNQGGAGALTAVVSGNTLRRCADTGINLDAGDGASTVNATVTGNQVLDLADVDAGQGLPRHAFFANLAVAAADTGTSCLDVRGNTFAGGPYGHGLRIWHRYATLRLPSYAGAVTDGNAVAAFLAGLNTVTTSSALAPVIASTPVSGTYVGGATCPTP